MPRSKNRQKEFTYSFDIIKYICSSLSACKHWFCRQMHLCFPCPLVFIFRLKILSTCWACIEDVRCETRATEIRYKNERKHVNSYPNQLSTSKNGRDQRIEKLCREVEVEVRWFTHYITNLVHMGHRARREQRYQTIRRRKDGACTC